MARPAGHKLSRTAWEDFLRITGRTLTDIAKTSEVPRPTLSSLVGGHHRASVPQAHRIAAAAGVQPATFFPTLTVEFVAAPIDGSKVA